MKTKLLRTCIYVCVLVLASSCFDFGSAEESTEENTERNESSTAMENDSSAEEVIARDVPVKIDELEINEEAKEVLKERVDNSPFRKLECCGNEETRFDDCCCEKVFEEYKALAETNSLGDLNLTDQILIDCKKGSLAKKFEEVDFAGVEDEWDDI